jgi:hypothetical protein
MSRASKKKKYTRRKKGGQRVRQRSLIKRHVRRLSRNLSKYLSTILSRSKRNEMGGKANKRKTRFRN